MREVCMNERIHENTKEDKGNLGKILNEFDTYILVGFLLCLLYFSFQVLFSAYQIEWIINCFFGFYAAGIINTAKKNRYRRPVIPATINAVSFFIVARIISVFRTLIKYKPESAESNHSAISILFLVISFFLFIFDLYLLFKENKFTLKTSWEKLAVVYKYQEGQFSKKYYSDLVEKECNEIEYAKRRLNINSTISAILIISFFIFSIVRYVQTGFISVKPTINAGFALSILICISHAMNVYSAGRLIFGFGLKVKHFVPFNYEEIKFDPKHFLKQEKLKILQNEKERLNLNLKCKGIRL